MQITFVDRDPPSAASPSPHDHLPPRPVSPTPPLPPTSRHGPPPPPMSPPRQPPPLPPPPFPRSLPPTSSAATSPMQSPPHPTTSPPSAAMSAASPAASRSPASAAVATAHQHHQHRTLDTLNAATLPRLLDPALAHLRDVTLIPAKSPGRTVTAHRFVLAAASPVLRASLAADPAASVLTLAHADATSLDAALQFVYGRHAAVDRLPAHALWTALSVCISYAILQPLDAVQTRLLATVDFHNVFYHWTMAEKYSLDAVQIRCRNMLKGHFVAVSKQPEFLDLCSTRLARVLRIHDLVVDSEHDVFNALERWLAFDVDTRAEHALQLLRLVRLPTMPDRTLLRVCRSPYFGGHNEFYQLLLEALIRRTEVRIVHGPRIAAVVKRARAEYPSTQSAVDDDDDDQEARRDQGAASSSQHPQPRHLTQSPFRPLGVSDFQVLPAPLIDQAHSKAAPDVRRQAVAPGKSLIAHAHGTVAFTRHAGVDFNRKEDRTVLFEGQFPLRWYKSVRFRPRSTISLLFTVVIPKWSSCRRRFISESRSFLNHKWSLWVDPFSSDPTTPIRESREYPKESAPPTQLGTKTQTQAHIHGDVSRPGSTIDPDRSKTQQAGPQFSSDGTSPTGRRTMALTNPEDETDYISIYLCCESELAGSQAVDARVDFALFVVSASEDFGMERKVCVGRTFKTHGQAMGFCRHIRRNRLHSSAAQLYSREKDELVVGAQLFAPNVRLPVAARRTEVSPFGTMITKQGGGGGPGGDEGVFESEGPLSPSTSAQLDASRMTTMDTEPSPILTATTSRATMT